MARKNIYLCLAHMSEEGYEQKYVKEAFDTNWVVPLGPNVDAFEQDLSKFYDDRKICAVNAGTSAIHLALMILGVGRGDEVLVQSFTFCASVNPIAYLGASPVFVDSESETWNMSPDLLEKAIEDRIKKTGKKPKAIVSVCLYGMPSKIEDIIKVAEKYGIPVIEDSAEAMGSRYKGRLCGTFGRFGILSFNGNKMITTSGGGALICPDDETRTLALKYATQSREPVRYYQHELMGYNFRLSNVCAGIGRGQMKILEQHINHHRHVHTLYREAFAGIDGITLKEAPSSDYEPNYWLSTVLLDEKLRVKKQGMVKEPFETSCQPADNVEAMIAALAENNIESRPLWKPMHLQPLYSKAEKYIDGTSESLFRRGLCLPSGPCVSDDDVRLVINCIKDNLEK